MSGLSPEALGQLEGLNLQEARRDFNFVSAVGTREPLNANLSADELNEFRNWDFSGFLAGLNSLTFEAMHPELVAASVETADESSNVEGDLPDWLKSLRTEMPAVETDSPAPLPEKPEKPVLDGPTAEEAAAELAVAAEAGPTTQAIGANGEGRILPAGEPKEEEVEEKAKNRLADWLKAVDWKRVALEGTTIIPPMVFGGLLGYLDPETARNISLATGTAGIGLAFTSMAAVMAERILPVHTRAGLLGRVLVAAKVVGLYGGNVLLSTAIGTHVGAGIREGIEVLNASQPVATGGGEGFNNPHPGHRPVDSLTGQVGGLSPEDRGIGAVVQPPAETGGVAAGVGQGGASPAEELQQMAEAAQGAAEMAARQAAEAHAATPVGITGADLSGGTIWGNELEFVKQLGVHHIEPVTNLLKNFSKILAQAQPATEIGPTDTAYVINRDVAGWAAGQADKLYGMDPSSMSSWQKSLWEIGRGLRDANWKDLQAVTEEFVRQSQP